VYKGDRITQAGHSLYESAKWRNHILHKVERSLIELGELTSVRRQLLIQYYYKDAKVLCEMDFLHWRAVYEHCKALDPAFRPSQTDVLTRFFTGLFGAYYGIRFFVVARRFFRMFGLGRRRHRPIRRSLRSESE
jgi:hypothetical protein